MGEKIKACMEKNDITQTELAKAAGVSEAFISYVLDEKKMPRSFINGQGNDVTEEFIRWAKPLIGGELPDFIHFN